MSTASAPGSSRLAADDPRYQLDALGCPHPESRRRALIQVSAGGAAMDLCIPCYDLFQEFRTRWVAGDIAPVEIRARMRQRGYDDADARQFISDLEEAA